ncbi:hypothetical protein GTP44_15480 [Duganella sp. FT50W]|uniref:Trypsin-like peptidase domain-containing protein n=1 Tax=Duganella lactea TaxID=2692173 RepID=A0A6L8MJL4_9BURK|nr:hypothetical protein [Duganella lactea]MYM83350.1 hypothetical protein [Duganella lactea]
MSSLPQNFVKAMGDFVDPFVTAIALIKPGDTRNPPGDHEGTGNFVTIDNRIYIVTCEHVARSQSSGMLGWTPFGSNAGLSIPESFQSDPYPVDIAATRLSSNSWTLVPHRAQCATTEMFANTHSPVEGEFLYVFGFPGSEATAGFGQHLIRGIGVITHEGPYDPVLLKESPVPKEGIHLCLPYLPEVAEVVAGDNGVLPLGDGLSGSFLWNTRYKEVTDAGGAWSPTDAQITGLVWGHSQKAGMLIASRVEDFRQFLGI